MDQAIRETYWGLASSELADWETVTGGEIDAVIKETGATAYEVLTMMACVLEGFTTDHGIDGPLMLIQMAANGASFREEVRTADEMRGAMKRIFRMRRRGLRN
jgi:hypothetical protein